MPGLLRKSMGIIYFYALIHHYMRKLFILSVIVLCAILSSCTRSDGNIVTKTFSYADSTKYAEVHISIDYPVSKSKVADSIRARLFDLLQGNFQLYCSGFDDTTSDPYPGDKTDVEAFVKYYGDYISQTANTLSKQDNDERIEYILNESDHTDEQKQDIIDGVFAWQFDITLQTKQTPKYIVFTSSDYLYTGGAHGGVAGLGSMTFSKETGKMIESFLVPESLEPLQGQLKKGLMGYFSEEGETITEETMMESLFIDGDIIPFPAFNPYPSKEGLVFVYQQYEIACYAAGMPAFTLPYEVVEPYLTEEAKAIL